MITKKSDYAIRLVRALSDGERHTAEELVRTQQVPKPFAYKILNRLVKAGLLDVSYGKLGGYMLSVDLNQLTLLDLMQVVNDNADDNLRVNVFWDPNEVCQCKENQVDRLCYVHHHLLKLQEKLVQDLSRHSINDILVGAVEYSVE